MANMGIVGMGYIGRVRLEASQKVPEPRVVAAVTMQSKKISGSLMASANSALRFSFHTS